MGQSTTTPAQMAGWFATTNRKARLDVSMLELATMFVEEGSREGVRGDIAYAQSIVETGYFGFSPSVAPETHNYSGLGATGGGVKGLSFPDARTGVRAQVQHLRAYADPSLRSAKDLRSPLVDPRFGFLVPNSKTVPCWEQFGNGIWAADPSGYGNKVLVVHQRVASFPRPKVAVVAAPAPAAAPVPAQEVPSAVGIPVAADPAVVAPEGGVEAGLNVPLVADAGLVLTRPGSATNSAIFTRPAGATRPGGGAAPVAASALTGLALLSICATLWWHGRRFSRT